MTHLEILKLIENVDPADAKKLDEIDLMVHSFITGWKVIEGDRIGKTGAGDMQSPPEYTRSRDALKAIRPKGYVYDVEIRGDGAKFYATKLNPISPEYHCTTTVALRTEELAELHSIIQAIAYERSKVAA